MNDFAKVSFEFVLKHLAFFEDFYDSNNKRIECIHVDYIYENDNTIDQESMENEMFSHSNSVFGKTLVAAENQATGDNKKKKRKMKIKMKIMV